MIARVPSRRRTPSHPKAPRVLPPLAHHKPYHRSPLLLLLTLVIMNIPTQAAPPTPSWISRFKSFPSTQSFEKRSLHLNNTHELILTSPRLDPGIDWTEAVLSWNTSSPADAEFTFELSPDRSTLPLAYYNLGRWSRLNDPTKRLSVPNQEDEFAKVETDVLVLSSASRALRLRVSIRHSTPPDPSWIKSLGVTCTGSGAPTHNLPKPEPQPTSATVPPPLEVPRISQLSFDDGKAWCSPTSLTMVMNYWSTRLKRPDLALDVPTTARSVFDPQWGGTGNWPFNTAFAGSFEGMRAHITRLEDIAELETLTAAQIPVITSVSYNRLKGLDRNGSGHLVVCVGFDANGDVILNDPGTRHDVRCTIPRDRFARAWRESKNTVYLVHPSSMQLPLSVHNHWE